MCKRGRHRGFDLYLITQHPKFIDQNIRRLSDVHFHHRRHFKSKVQTVCRWEGVNDEPEIALTDDDAQKQKKPYDPELFQFYRSSVDHTYKAELPYKKFAILAAAVVCSLTLFYFALNPFFKNAEAAPEKSKPVSRVTPVSSPANPGASSLSPPKQVEPSGRVSGVVSGPTGSYALLHTGQRSFHVPITFCKRESGRYVCDYGGKRFDELYSEPDQDSKKKGIIDGLSG
ncbi:hypothetical protein F6R98_09835 [Candidatus Methylospira mobilis]|uniref:Zona occludens toxin N-terminal domain-containing protein n=1 Tax=Candidatus Methylospira mobilis TaxID=1808979 RepID=A0A5Q0BKZ1_9GAMM|nr:zonular occludens toxin domain-containing protein [Candidatus Methylospira mobilis]QFY42874.1 hypothetical protein F6R98_09835 [Candidatus Methylospira mobilis]WNV04068.1 zonular occludens toxin domain-containing protein [Candidatus Methylospira mobilis]